MGEGHQKKVEQVRERSLVAQNDKNRQEGYSRKTDERVNNKKRGKYLRTYG